MDVTAILRRVTDDDGLDALMDDPASVRAVLDTLGEHVGLTDRMEVPPRGSAVVGLTDRVVVKMMAPHDKAYSDTELTCLRTLRDALPIPTPEVLETGDLEGWQWIAMSRLEGRELADVWPDLGGKERLSLATHLGEALAVLHGLEAPPTVERLDWNAWRATRLAELVATQRRKGCPEALLEGLEPFVTKADTSAGRMGWLHTEIMLEHLLVQHTAAGWRLSGLFDFEPSWVAPVDYEFSSVGLFVSSGESDVLREIMRASGVSASPERLFAMAMLHRYANLAWYHRRIGGPLDLSALANRWFG